MRIGVFTRKALKYVEGAYPELYSKRIHGRWREFVQENPLSPKDSDSWTREKGTCIGIVPQNAQVLSCLSRALDSYCDRDAIEFAKSLGDSSGAFREYASIGTSAAVSHALMEAFWVYLRHRFRLKLPPARGHSYIDVLPDWTVWLVPGKPNGTYEGHPVLSKLLGIVFGSTLAHDAVERIV
jgi:hypothetical protein